VLEQSRVTVDNDKGEVFVQFTPTIPVSLKSPDSLQSSKLLLNPHEFLIPPSALLYGNPHRSQHQSQTPPSPPPSLQNRRRNHSRNTFVRERDQQAAERQRARRRLPRERPPDAGRQRVHQHNQIKSTNLYSNSNHLLFIFIVFSRRWPSLVGALSGRTCRSSALRPSPLSGKRFRRLSCVPPALS
jgi:hypothetical protein